MPDATDLQKWYEEARTELEQAQQQLTAQQQRVNELEQKVTSYENLLVLEGALPESYSATGELNSDTLIQVVEDALYDSEGPLHLSSIRDALYREGIPIPGKGTDANIISRLQRSNGRIVRVGRGMYDIPRSRTSVCLCFPDGRTVELGESNSIGRSDENEIILADPEVSRRHAVITVKDGLHASIKDKGTVNGTLVNGRRVENCDLYDGDTIVIGETILTVKVQ